MGSGNWIVDNLNSALEMWNGRLAEIWQLISTSPESFKGGGVWNVIVNINDGLKAVGYALLVLFFVMGVVKTCGSFTEMKKPEVAFKCFIRFVLAQAAVSWGMELMTGAFRIAQGMVATIMDSSGLTAMSATTLPDELVSVIEDVGFIDSIPLWAVTLLGSLFIWVLSLVMILTVYSRFFKLYIATAIAPVPLDSFAGQPSSSIGVAFLKSYAAICLEGCVIVLACVIFSAFASSPPAIADDTLAAATIVWNYVGELIFNMLVLFFVMGVVKTCGSFAEMKKPEMAFKCFIRFVLAQAAVSWGMELMTGAFRVAQGMVTTIIDSSGLTAMSATTLPDELVSVIEDVGFIDSIPLWAVTLLGSLFIWVLSLVMILTVYSRFFKLYIATAIAPIPLASFAGQPSSSIGVAFLKSYAAICMEGCVIVLACVIFSAFASSPPAIADDTLAAATIVWNYVGELIFNMLVLVGAIKMSDRIIRELMGLG